jgi:hypothetical protein
MAIFDFFRKNKKKKPIKLELHHIEVGDDFRIESDEIKGRFGIVTCIGNEPTSRRIFISIRWTSKEIERRIVSYDDYMFKNLSLINQDLFDVWDDSDYSVEEAISTLKNHLDCKVKHEKYEEADTIIKKVQNVILRKK